MLLESTPPRFIDTLGQQQQEQQKPPPPAPAQAPGIMGEFGQGVAFGTKSLGPQAVALGGLGAKVFGFDDIAQQMLQYAQESQTGIDQQYPTDVAFESVFDSPGNFARFAARNLGEQAPIIGSIILGGGVGGLIGRLVGRGALTAAEGVAGASRFGAEVGALTTGAGIETASTGQEIYGATGEVNPGVAFSAGIAKGALEAIVPLAFARRFGISSTAAEGILGSITKVIDQIPSKLGRIATGAALGVGVEGATEMLQEAIDVGARAYVDENYDALGPGAAMRILQAGFTGALVGGVLGGVGLGHEHGAQDTPPGKGNETPLERIPTTEPGAPQITPVVKNEPPSPTVATTPGISEPTVSPAPAPKQIVGTTQAPIAEPSAVTAQVEVPGEVAPQETPLPTLPEAADPQFHPAYAVHADETSGPTEFLSPKEAQFAQAQNPNAKVYALTHDVVQGADTTVSIHDLPLKITDQNVDFPIGMETEKAAAVSKIQLASDIIQKANTLAFSAGEGQSAEPQYSKMLSQANDLYNEAVAQGARVRPQEGQGFRLASPLAMDQTPVQVQNVPGVQSIDTGVHVSGYGGPGFRMSGDTVTVTSTPTDSITRNNIFAKQFSVDTKRVEEAGGVVSTLEPSSWISTLGRAIDVIAPGGSTTTEASVLRTVLAAVPEIKTTKRLSDFALQRVFARFKTFKQKLQIYGENHTQTKQALLNVIKAGVSLRPASSTESQVIIAPKHVFMGALREAPSIPYSFARKLTTQFHNSDTGAKAALTGTTDINMQKYSPSAHVEGTARVIPSGITNDEGMEIAPVAIQVQAFANDLLAQFGLKLKLVINIANLVDGRNGSYQGFAGSDLAIIRLNKSMLQRSQKSKLINVLVHEFGHLLVHHRFKDAPASMKAKIYGAYQRAMIKASMGTGKDLAGMFTVWRTSMQLDPPHMSRATTELLRDLPNYHMSFDEYMAEQVARYFTNSERALTHIEKWFKGIANDFKQLYHVVAQRFGLSRMEFLPATQVREWLESIKQNVEGMKQSQTPIESEIAHSEMQSWEQNSHILSPGTPSGELEDKVVPLLDFAGIKGKEAKTLKAGIGRINWLMKWLYTIRQLALVNPGVKGLRLYNELIDRWALTKAQVQTRADGTIKAWRALSIESQTNLAKFIFDVEGMDYLKLFPHPTLPGREMREEPRLPTDAELLRIAKKHNISTEAFEVYQRMRGDLLAFLDKMEAISKRDVQSTVKNEVIAQLRIAEIEKEFKKLRNRPYFPHSRFGDFTVVVKGKDGKTTYMEQFATRAEAQAAFEEISKDHPDEFVRVDKIPEEVKPFRGMPPALLSKIRELPGVTEQQKLWLEQLTLDLAPTQSFRKRLIRRQNVAGFSLDAMRSYANYMWHGANYLARIEFQGPLQEAVSSVHSEASDMHKSAGKDVSKLREIADFMQNHLDQVLNPAPDWAQLRSIAFTWWLGFSPAAAFTNLTQNVMTTYPYLGARFGDLQAANAMRKAIMDIQRIARGKTEAISDAQVKATQRAVEKGITDESFASELAATAEGHNLAGLLPGNKLHRLQMEFSHYAGWMYQHAEKFNRRVAFAAGWRLAMEHPESKHLQELKEQNQLEYQSLIDEGYAENEALAYLSARDAVWTTQFQYSAAARPRLLRGKQGVLLAFFSFVQNSLFFATHDKGRIRFLLMMMLMGGLMGLPGAEDIMSLVRFAARKLLGEDVNIEKEAREFIIGLAGPGVEPDLVLHGISRVGFGLHHALELAGLPAPKFDLSPNISMGQIVPGVSALGPPSKDLAAIESQIAETAAGAVYGIGLNVLKFLSDDELPWMDGKRFERALPRAVKGVAKAYRYLDEGRERSRSGGTIVKFDASDPDQLSEIVGQALGLTPTRLSREWDRRRMEQESIAFWSIRRTMLMQQFDHAFQSGDKAVMQDMISAVRRYNNEIAIPGYQITSQELNASRKAHLRSRRLSELGLPDNKKDIPLSRDIRKLFPETEGGIIDAETMKPR